MANNKPKYDPNGRYKVLKAISHPEATHPDGCIRPYREGTDVVVSMKHRANLPQAIVLLVEEVKALEYLGPAEKASKS